MLQQTQVVTVLRYYKDFLREFPTVHRLAAAPVSRVLAHWAGMGYYSRARNLHRAARILVNEFKGKIPNRYEDIRKLPGIGRYTAGAILSIAFGQRYPVVDGNVERVLARILALQGDLHSQPHQKILWAAADWLVPGRSPSDFNQGLMELGATVCLPRQPQCGCCPVESLCDARRRNLETRIPQPRRVGSPQKIQRLAVIIRDRRNRILLVQRRDERLMRDFWEFPQFDLPRGSERRQEMRHVSMFLARAMQRRLGGNLSVERLLFHFHHSITFRRIDVRVFEGRLTGDLMAPCPEDVPIRWVPANRLRKYLFDSASLKILAALQKS